MNRTETDQNLLPLTPESDSPRSGLRKRLKLASAPSTPLEDAPTPEAPPIPQDSTSEPQPVVNAEMLETLSRLHESLGETANEIARDLERTAEQTARQLRETAEETARHSEAQASNAIRRMTELQQSLSEAEQNLAYTVERLRRENGRAGWMQTGVIVLALLAGTLGGTAAALLILAWLR